MTAEEVVRIVNSLANLSQQTDRMQYLIEEVLRRLGMAHEEHAGLWSEPSYTAERVDKLAANLEAQAASLRGLAGALRSVSKERDPNG